ncbi:MAG: enterochelin esterase [Myxococcales bacterium]|nr:enterochelin esterase [Myxococcales bacterium]
MTHAIEELIASNPTSASVDEWMQGKRFPFVEGSTATFVYRGEASEVHLRHWIFGLESAQALARIEGTDAWHLTFEIPPRSRVEYKFEIQKHGGTRWIQDPLNPHRARDPFGANSVLAGEGYVLPEWSREDALTRRGTLEPFAFESRSVGGSRSGYLYLPARFRPSRRYPLLVVHDGSDYIKYAGLRTVLDNLIHRLEIPDLIAVFLDSPDRLREYADDEAHARFLTEELVPHLESRLPLIAEPRGRCLMGASFGGVASLSTACRYPGFWGRLCLQSGSFAFTDIGSRNHRGPRFDNVVKFMNAFRNAPAAVSERVFVSCGVYESLIYENRSLVPLLDATGMQVRFVEARDGHNWENWRDRSREGLSWLFPGPLMMIYE